MKIAHIVNPVLVSDKSDLYVAQPITFETMRKSREAAKTLGIEVDLFYTCYEEDLSIAPENFKFAGLLDRSVIDVNNFSCVRKLPLIKDILDRLYKSSDAEYFIYTNVDISLYENFYEEVKSKIDFGYDSFVINRRTLTSEYTSIDEVDQMYKDKGEEHPGYDCFVFRRDAYNKYNLGATCIGANWIGRALISNLITKSTKFKIFDKEYLTFHIGDDRSWKIEKYNDYDVHNQHEVRSILKNIEESGELYKSELLVRFKKQFDDDNKIRLIHESNPFFDFINIKNKSVNQSPVFIIGFPRSGTTLIQSLISTQNTYTFPETHYFNIVLNTIKVEEELIVDDFKQVVSMIEERYPLSENAKDYLWLRIKNKNLSVKLLFEILVLDGLIKQGIAEDELSTVYWLEKTPSHAFKLDLISRYYPQAKFIYILRDPLHAFSSWRRVSQGWGQESQAVEEYADLWGKLLNAAETFKINRFGKLMFIRLEDLVSNTTLVMGDIMSFIGRDFEPSALENRNKDTSAYILPTEAWKIEGAVKEISSDASIPKEDLLSLFEKIKSEFLLRDYMKKYGYQFKYWNDKSLGMCDQAASGYDSIDGILERIYKLSSARFVTNPMKKFRLYKKLINEYEKYIRKNC
ncbi:MAG: sulfotransferase [Gammaproteobacteria bacterium]|nr:sulfotransferase [Gammaproteobacteria bacterium]MCW8922222.1 sulfotransferase [Gammaproteobacteria bacterium]